jgi:hypothetical protein
MMENQEYAFLRALYSAMNLDRITELEADRVNDLARSFRLEPADAARIAERLAAEGFVQFHWGGKIALTPEGKHQAEGKTPPGAPGSVQFGNVGPGANVVVGSPHAVVGPGAMGAGAVKIEATHGLGDLVAALQALRRAHEQLTPEAKETSHQLTDEVEAIVHEVQQPQPDKVGLEQRLDKAAGLMNKLVGIADAATKLGPTLAGLGTACETIRGWIMGG